MRFIVDTLGSDLGPNEIVKGVISAAKNTNTNYLLVGPETLLKKQIQESDLDLNRFEFLDTSEFISNDDEPVRAIRRKKESSLVLALNKLNEPGYDGLLSAGSTGGILAGGLFITGRIKGIERAVLTAELPSENGPTVLIDTGANMDTTADMQRQFALMGTIYSSVVLKKENPKVYLLNVGSEKAKGNKLSKKAYEALEHTKDINFQGNIEARDILSGKADVIVTDGFAGNIALKAIEGTAGLLFSEIKEGISSSFKSKLGALLVKDVFKQIANKYNYKEVGAAQLLGIQKAVFKAHGSSDSQAIKNAILKSEQIISTHIIDFLERETQW